MDNLFDLPAHPLLVHVPVAFTPLAALGAVVVSVRASWRQRLGWVVAGVAALALAGTHLAIESGDALEERVRETSLVERHEELSRMARPLALVLLFAVVALVAYDSYQRRRALAGGPGATRRAGGKPVVAALAAITVLAAAASVVGVIRAGHSGARAVWENSPALERPITDH